MNMNKFAISIILVIISSVLSAQKVQHINEEITADGVLDEAAWSQIEPFSGFHNFFPINEGDAKFDTEVKVFQDGDFLNIAIVYHDTLSEVRVNSMKRDDYGSGFHLSDCVGVIIDPYNNQNRGYFFALNGAGTQLDALIANYDNENLSWDAIWESGYTVEGTDKIYEMKIPLSAISYDEAINNWSFQFYTRDAKDRMYTVWNKFERGFLQFDTRFLKQVEMENLKPSKAARTTIIPALTGSFLKNVEPVSEKTNLQPSLDVQYKISDGLRLDATINPDFSQVEVDQQVTNLTRFNIVFPERRNFFIENSDMFTTLGADNNINPFFSRFIGADRDILAGLKLSGNVAPNTRIGLLNVQSKKDTSDVSQNYTVAVAKQQFGQIVNATGYLINRQTLENFSVENEYNRVAGLKVNYLSLNRKWSGFTTFSNSFSEDVKGQTHAFSVTNNYNTRTLSFSTKFNTVGKNYLTDIGFVPRIYNFDALNQTVIREGYSQLSQRVTYNHYPKDQSVVQTYRLVNASVDTYFDEDGALFETNYFSNTAVFFANQMSTYLNLYHDDIKLKYSFDPLRTGSFILPGNYKNTAVRFGINTDYTRNLYGSINFQTGSFFEGKRTRVGTNLGFRKTPYFSLELNYEYNTLDFSELGNQQLHLLGASTQIFFNNKLNWTTYIQYNEQFNNFNINSRLQWEYQPLSFVYLVYSDNYDKSFLHKDWTVSIKVNRRFNF